MKLKRQNICKELYNNVGKGWWPILDKHLPQILELVSGDSTFVKVKEKFGLLRIQVYGNVKDRDKFNELSREAERTSAAVCEMCGASGELQSDEFWLKTLCDKCAAEASGEGVDEIK